MYVNEIEKEFNEPENYIPNLSYVSLQFEHKKLFILL